METLAVQPLPLVLSFLACPFLRPAVAAAVEVESGWGCGKTTAVSVLRIISANCVAAADGFLALRASSVSAVSSSVGVDSSVTWADVVVLSAVEWVGLPD